MSFEPGKTYKIKGGNKYFKDKYKTNNPEFRLENTFESIFDRRSPFDPSLRQIGVVIFQARARVYNLPRDGQYYYGHVNGLGEIVHESELEET